MTLLFIFLFGLCIGSFINVLAERLPMGKNPWKGRSKCDYCHHTLRLLDLFPIFSFLLLKAKCRYCHKKLSWQYPIVEVITGLMFVGIFIYQFSNVLNLNFLESYSLTVFLSSHLPVLLSLHLPIFLSFISLLILFSAFLVIFISDIKYQIIPDEMLWVIFIATIPYLYFYHISIYDNLISGIGVGIFFLLIYFSSKILLKKEGMGFGDVKLAPLLGLFLGSPKIVIAMYLAFLTGAIVSIILILLGQKKLKSTIAFGPFMLVGSIISFFYGGQIWNWYQNFFR